MPGRKPSLLILGGTGDAVRLSHAAEQRFADRLSVIYSLAGRTRAPAQAGGELRVGGFGGIDGLARYIRDHGIDYLIDASHPFSAQISQHACLAAAATATPRCVFARPPWQARQGDDWHEVADMAAAAAKIPALGRRAFLSLGARSLGYFSALSGIWFLVRLIEAPAQALPLAEAELITGRGPFDVASERRLFEEHRIDVIVTRASGGTATEGKIDAARSLSLPVVMIARPAPPPGGSADSIEAVLLWLERGLGR